MSRRLAPRGQSTVELALGLGLMVPVIMVGWAFAESGWVSLKVVEAADSALWDTTADRRPAAADALAFAAAARYADLDGRSSTSGATGPVQVTTSTTAATVSCQGIDVAITQPPLIEQIMPPTRGRSCSARAETRLFGNFTRPHCSSGRPNGLFGPCRGAQSLALDDGAIFDHRECPIQMTGGSCINQEYFSKVDTLTALASPMSTTPVALVQATLQDLPPYASSTLSTYMSFRGEEAPYPFEDSVPYPGDGEFPRWQTTPYDTHPQYRDSYSLRTSCYLGRRCDGASINDP